MRWTLIVMVLLLLCLAGCTTAATPNETPEPFRNTTPTVHANLTDEPITLEVWLDLDFTRDNFFQEIATEFKAQYPNVEINIQSFVGESIAQKVQQAILTGTPPDVVQGHVYVLAGQGLATPLESQWQAWNSNIETEFLPAAMNEVTWRGERYGVPLDIYTLVLLYNQTHFDDAGIAYPDGAFDFISLRNAAATLTHPTEDRYGLGFTADPWYVYTWMSGAGGDVLVGTPETGFELTLNSTTNIDALRFLTDMADAGYGPLPTTRPRDYKDALELFLAGKVSMYIGGPWDIHLIQSQYPDFPLGVARLPTTPAADSAASVLGSTGLFIPTGASHQTVAFEFIKWVTQDHYAFDMARRLGRYPAKTWVLESPYFTENLLLLPFFDQLSAARPYRLGLYPAAEEAFADAIKVSFYNLDPAEALTEAQSIGQLSVEQSPP